MSGEEVMLRALYELVISGENQFNIATNVFGRDQSQQSRAFKWFINQMFSTFEDLVIDNLDWWYQNGYLNSEEKNCSQHAVSSTVIVGNVVDLVVDLAVKEKMQ